MKQPEVKKPTAKATPKTNVKAKNESLENIPEINIGKASKTDSKKPKEEFVKQEEKVLNINDKKTQNSDNQVNDVLKDFFNEPTENANESTNENTWENPPIEPIKNDTTTLDDGTEIPSIDSGKANIDDWGTAFDDIRIEKDEDLEASMDLNASDFFEDSDFMAETIVEILDMGAVMGLSALAKDFNNPSADVRWGLSDAKKKKIIKPLKMVLQKREVKTSPEAMLIMVLVAAYIPSIITALAERSAKKKDENSIVKAKKEAIKEKLASDGRPPKCQRCKKEVDTCICPEGPKLSSYMKQKLGIENKKEG